jgi:hypothetical protein
MMVVVVDRGIAGLGGRFQWPSVLVWGELLGVELVALARVQAVEAVIGQIELKRATLVPRSASRSRLLGLGRARHARSLNWLVAQAVAAPRDSFPRSEDGLLVEEEESRLMEG